MPSPAELPARTGRLHIEIVSHCWQYSHLLAYQLSSLVLHPPENTTVTMTVFHNPEDAATSSLLRFIGQHRVSHVAWHWRALDREHLFRRAIGRNLAALESTADWVWFTDCDVVFHRGCLDALAGALQGRRDLLVFPREERCTALLSADDAILQAAAHGPAIVDIDPTSFETVAHARAVGPLQITHGDIARRFGYCASLGFYQRPAQRWQKALEDRAFRWLLRTEGTPIDVPGVYRIRHLEKGRYRSGHWTARLRQAIRRHQAEHRTSGRGTTRAPEPALPRKG